MVRLRTNAILAGHCFGHTALFTQSHGLGMPERLPETGTNSRRTRRDGQRRRRIAAEWLSELVLIEDEDRRDIFAIMEFGAEARSGGQRESGSSR
jgi:hypothetical protein